MKIGNITKRGERSFRVKIEIDRDPATGRRRYFVETIRGRPDEALRAVRERAKARLVELHDKMAKGQHVEPTGVTLQVYMESWLLAPVGISPKTLERYRQLAEQQIYPHLGAVPLQKLGPAHVQDWHATLLVRGGAGGRPLGARTVGHAHRVLHRALARALEGQLVFRNTAALVKPPKVDDQEVAALKADQIGDVLDKLRDHALYPIVVLALGSGLRRGELLALRWSDVDLDAASVRVERSLEETKAGLRFKAPKSRHGRRSVSLPATVVETLRTHRRAQLELRMALGLGKAPDDALVFCQPDGEPMSPDKLSRDWCRLVAGRKLPKVSFHALRHSHVSALIDGGLDVFSVSRRIGHGSAALTLRTYTHLFTKRDGEAAAAIEAALTR